MNQLAGESITQLFSRFVLFTHVQVVCYLRGGNQAPSETNFNLQVHIFDRCILMFSKQFEVNTQR